MKKAGGVYLDAEKYDEIGTSQHVRPAKFGVGRCCDKSAVRGGGPRI